MLLMQTWLWQSPAPEHTLPLAQSLGQVPPQSTSVSPPLSVVSVQVGSLQVLVGLPLQTLLTQSVAPLHVLPPAHLLQLEPQSTSVSVPFLAPSSHFGT
jgi:hypothetical protein